MPPIAIANTAKAQFSIAFPPCLVISYITLFRRSGIIVLMAYGIGSALGIITVGNTFIACMLTILGYSINSTIVTFDRIRENRQAMGKKADLEDIVNTSVSQTITRNINTTLTTFIMIFMLLLLGVSSLREFTIPLIAGLIAGAFSSICLTSAMWYHVKRLFSSKKK